MDRRLVSAAVLLLSAAAAVCSASCDKGYSFPAERTLTSTVTLSGVTALDVKSVLPVEVLGDLARTSALITVRATVTASSAARAKALAAQLALGLDKTNPASTLAVALKPLPDSSLSGTMTVNVPSGLAATVGSNGPVRVAGLQQAVSVAGPTNIEVDDAGSDVTVQTSSGNVVVDTRFPAGSTVTIVCMAGGNIVLSLPQALSASIDATVGTGQVVVTHPKLPMALGYLKTHYKQTVGGGFAKAVLYTARGQITIQQR